MASLPLWPASAPGALGVGRQHHPHLTFFEPAAHAPISDATVLILPGGGYAHLSDHEGAGYARWLAARGIFAAVLDYRLATHGYHHPAMLQDAARALRTLRALARAQDRSPDRIAVMGSSAGGHLAATLSTLFAHADAADSVGDAISRESARPDATILCYPVIDLDPAITHPGSRTNILGPSPAPGLEHLLSTSRQVSPSTPPAFIWHTADDELVPVANALAYASACWRTGVGCSLHVFPHGAHGLGLGSVDQPAPPWPGLLENWLQTLGWLPAN